MDNEELVTEMKKIRRNLENARKKLRNAQRILNENITFNNEGLKDSEIEEIITKLDNRIYNLNNKIIPKLNSM